MSIAESVRPTVLRTPDERFADLPDFPFAPNYVTIGHDYVEGGLRVHYIDEGPRDARETVVLLHGEPSWSYLYRHMIPVLVAAGHRVIAPDLVGFGRSDKVSPRTEYTYAQHIGWLRETLFGALDLTEITLFCQDWGGLLGLRLVGEHSERFCRVMASNTFLPTGDGAPSEAFMNWQRFSQTVPELPVGFILQGASTRQLTDAEVAAYNAPFPDESYKEGARQFPLLVPTSPDDPAREANLKAWESLEKFSKPFLTAFGADDRVTAGCEAALIRRIPGAAGQPHVIIPNANHFIQEDVGPELAHMLCALIDRTPCV